jgi:hypothetical protein
MLSPQLVVRHLDAEQTTIAELRNSIRVDRLF